MVQWFVKTVHGSVEQWAASLNHSDKQEWEIGNIKIALLHAADRVQDEQKHANSRFIQDTQKHMFGVLRWTKDLLRHNSRRTLLITNMRRCTDPKPTNVHGYRYADADRT